MKIKKKFFFVLKENMVNRCKLELSSIINDKASYFINYLLTYKIVKKAKEDGFLVGSLGSFGSSLVANLLGITEVNPLPQHYLCYKCKK
jgi:DNA polymerase-3 subunit alpha (Gram-positive type)